jgi:hypothetical protein
MALDKLCQSFLYIYLFIKSHVWIFEEKKSCARCSQEEKGTLCEWDKDGFQLR